MIHTNSLTDVVSSSLYTVKMLHEAFASVNALFLCLFQSPASELISASAGMGVIACVLLGAGATV